MNGEMFFSHFQDNVTLCTLGVGRAFGESISGLSLPHSATVVTNECCELLRIDQRDFQLLWEVSYCCRNHGQLTVTAAIVFSH